MHAGPGPSGPRASGSPVCPGLRPPAPRSAPRPPRGTAATRPDARRAVPYSTTARRAYGNQISMYNERELVHGSHVLLCWFHFTRATQRNAKTPSMKQHGSWLSPRPVRGPGRRPRPRSVLSHPCRTGARAVSAERSTAAFSVQIPFSIVPPRCARRAPPRAMRDELCDDLS